jgi:hypothetical protein
MVSPSPLSCSGCNLGAGASIAGLGAARVGVGSVCEERCDTPGVPRSGGSGVPSGKAWRGPKVCARFGAFPFSGGVRARGMSTLLCAQVCNEVGKEGCVMVSGV